MASDAGYEAGDVNVVAGGAAADEDFEDELDDELDDGFDGDLDDELDDGFDGDLDDELDDDLDDGNSQAGEGNRSTGGTPVAVLDYLARALADEPDAVVVRTEERRGALLLRLHVAPGDMGRVIGRRGRTAQAIRTLVAVAGSRDGVQTNVDIVDE
ncbi:MAG: KH domain-containing protein [Actinomycetota bacterium]|jgi:predicted RNA-binding protein YlqC (UPF0109 family)|nr:KH domain-containing protein [Actinomycetota bacterium]